ncbi:hypothetical protein [Macrococcus armenti]|uniref:hypothetical protein n=1 Tax=Macrococcus armenti TaxID=2875764 RepID=UPI001CCAC206|nr:hypothetical protein [Macrococcus armenti]UBH08295.1 hypothetical protein LAU41_09940 [Macrococcus armenti]UBH10526.1 hypothetical protein LAU38_09860 [Macrococcus armenti]
MNKFDKKMQELRANESVVTELISKKIRSEKSIWMDVIFNFAFTLKSAFNQLKNMKAYYLEEHLEQYNLYIIDKALNVEKIDVTDAVNKSLFNDKFVYNEVEYSKYRTLNK